MFRSRRTSHVLRIAFLLLCGSALNADSIEGFAVTGQFREQVRVFRFEPGVTATMVAPPARDFDPQQPTRLILYALPNGNTTEQTIGNAVGPDGGLKSAVEESLGGPRRPERGTPSADPNPKSAIPGAPGARSLRDGVGVRNPQSDDWHFDIQHIGAQMRLLRAAITGRNLVIAYLENAQKSWPAWKAANANNAELIAGIVTRLRAALPGSTPDVCLTGHSGGGSFTFGFINGFESIPSAITRIAFLDSNYAFGDDPQHGPKLIEWLRGDAARRLMVIAYDDRNIELNGKKVVSETGGTYRATYRMVEAFRTEMPLEEGRFGSFIRFSAPQIEILIHPNPENKILHTVLVGEFNGFIHVLGPDKPRASWDKPLASMEGPRAYTGWVERPAPSFEGRVAATSLPPRPAGAIGGTAFMQSLAGLGRDAREAAVLRELMSGNIPEFLRRLAPISVKANDADGREHTAVYQVMPDYLAIGSDADFVRIPMNPHTAQSFCNAFGFALPTPKVSDDVWREAVSKIVPQPLTVERDNVLTFLTHHRTVEEQLAGQHLGELRAGHKKDVVLTNHLTERPNRIAIYGWHFPSGQPIQPVTIVHLDWYVDYSHGVRPVLKTITVDGGEMQYEQVLRDPKLHVLLSNEGVMQITAYPPAK